MANALPTPPYRTPMMDANGLCTPQWAAFFREVVNRIGGSTGQSTTELETSVTTLTADITTLQNEIYDAAKGRTL